MDNQVKYYEAKLRYEIDPSDLFEALNKGEDVVVIDARKPFGYDTEHIPGSINIPYRSMTAETTRHLNKQSLYVIYCDGIGCNASTKGALSMVRLGFNVKELMGGFQWWKADGYQTEGAQATDGLKLKCAC
jgi:rhodanese-related sulfurtransferase